MPTSEPAVVFDPYRDRMYRLCFVLAAVYNVAFGIWTVFWPDHFFDLMRMRRPLYPEVWQCLGMIVGLYGLGYTYAAWRLDRGQPLIALGLAGKVLGPVGYLLMADTANWPLRTLPINIFNDVVWWIPFGMYLLEGTQAGRRIRENVPLCCALYNGLAALAMALFLSPGTGVVRAVGDRLDYSVVRGVPRIVNYINDNPLAWRGGWLLWMVAALSLVSFYAWWGARIQSFAWAVAAFLIASAGLVVDLFFESLFIGWLPRDYLTIYPQGLFVMGMVANGAYSLAGAMLTLATPQLRGAWRVWAWSIWVSGFALCAAAWQDHVPAIVITTGLMMTLFCPFAVAMRWKLA
jgi:hypothetical protein